MSKGTWEDFVGQYSVYDIIRCLEDEASAMYELTLGEAIECIVGSIYDDTDFWWTDELYREFLRTAYPDKDAAIKAIKHEVIDEMGLN